MAMALARTAAVLPTATRMSIRCIAVSPKSRCGALDLKDVYAEMKFKLGEADRLSRQGRAREALSMYAEARIWAEEKNVMAQVRGANGEGELQRFAGLMPPMGCNTSTNHLQVVIESALVRAEEASSLPRR
eukprot:gnl/TRDRNA2_/TRDRNA2_186640_c0_seq1.p2 gnl/TRDRNA2_/TRDRNA2_186640_c0~~gnl/TRDRNA2_/TRDRNA2_186640_c0_seq1.p2  ORF type:complete len:131 (-),score=24.91 gnl/TRDRNA2_/TRDRNA2_186640_c0_seq1:144-536(-)